MTGRLLVVLLLTAITAARAVVNPTPLPLLTEIEGLWKGQLRYRDYSKPDEFVTLPTTLAIAMSAPDEIELHFTYDEGRGRFVSSYERIQFDLAHSELHWSGATPDDNYRGQISARTEEDNRPASWSPAKLRTTGEKSFSAIASSSQPIGSP